MNVKKKARRVMSGLLTAVTVLSTVLSPAVAYASDDAGSVKKIPYYEEIKSYNVTLAIGKTTTKNATDKRTNAKLNIAKQDAETGNEAQGDATLEGAVYGLYAREDIVHPDGKTGTIYKKDTLITSLTTDKNGEASVSDLYLGKYYLKELSAPVGYVLDPTEHDVDCTYEGATVPTVERTSVCKETVIKQPFQIIKAANNGKTDADLLQGVGFSAWLVSDLKVKADGSYDFDSARPVVLTADGQTEMFTDEAPDGFVSSDEVLRFDASYQGQDVQTVTLKSVKKNQPTTVEITKSDATTGVELDGAYLKVTDKDGNVVDSWTSSKDAPHVIKYLKVGETYTLHEEFAPHGYLVAKYSEEKPWSCKYCYWWGGKKKGCSLKQCHYLLPEKKKAVKTTPCGGCPYGKHVPCIGYCIARLHSEMKGKKGRG